MLRELNMTRMRAPLPIIVAIALTVLVLSGRAATGPSQIAVKDRSNAYPSVAALGQFAAIAWGASTKEGATDIYSAISHDGGRTFGAPTRVNQVAGDANLSGEQ